MKWMLWFSLWACGAPAIAPEEETNARWTTGDDQALEAASEDSGERADE